ncbi:uncharacterized protein LOC128985467 isoform X2 [Macrosteles quadrilineatus]|nr:uncharacterized protein LOC128985467 isoform X2 [Macrosteles quadrilineatus]
MVKLYAKHKTSDRRVCWENLSKRLPGRVGTINEVLTDDMKSIMISYSSDDAVAYNLDCSTDYILVPQPLSRLCKDTELKILSYGGPDEYLVLKENEITFDGEECDKAGVNYAAFARQLHRCQQEAGSCLHNQPLHYWRRDKEAAKAGKSGHYFLKNFIEVTDQAILQNTTSNQVVLRAPYFKRYQSHVVIEMNADHIEIIGDKSEGQITEVYADATSEKVTIVKAVVTNLGIASDYFGVDFSNCTSRLGPSDFDKPGKDEIPPQHRITYTAMISSPLKNRRVDCKMVLYNLDHEVVASRQIIIVQGQRCMCVWHCQCVCYNHPSQGLPCYPLSVSDYNNAGFPGHLPVTLGSDCSTLFTVLHALLWFFVFLLLFGLIKAVLGLCISNVALWGLWYLLPDEAKCLQVYQEPQYACCPLVRDCDDFPIHPYSYKRSQVHFLPWYSEFIVNVFFFICVFRSCICDYGFPGGNAGGYYYRDCGYTKRRGRSKYSPGNSTRHGSPCASICSKRQNRRFRMTAGAEEEFLNPDPQLVRDEAWAKHLVAELTRAYVVFRVLTRPMGGVKSVPGIPYCIRGFFLESDNGVYEFTPPSPLMQIWQMDGSPLDPPMRLDPGPFHTLYHSPGEVLAAHELSPWAKGVVINAP